MDAKFDVTFKYRSLTTQKLSFQQLASVAAFNNFPALL